MFMGRLIDFSIEIKMNKNHLSSGRFLIVSIFFTIELLWKIYVKMVQTLKRKERNMDHNSEIRGFQKR